MKEIDVHLLWGKALELIAADLDAIKVLGDETGKLDHDAAMDLARYASLLDDIRKQTKEEEIEDKKRIGKMSTQDIQKRLNELRADKTV